MSDYKIDLEECVKRLNEALEEFSSKESDLLKQNAHEEAISTALIKYLSKFFSDFPYNIDSQYDKRIINDEVEKKHTKFLIERLPFPKRPEEVAEGADSIIKEILPDVIFHERISPNHNFLIIEIKKSTNKNKADRDYDALKLEVATSQDLNYEYGVFIDFACGEEFDPNAPFNFRVYHKGKIIAE